MLIVVVVLLFPVQMVLKSTISYLCRHINFYKHRCIPIYMCENKYLQNNNYLVAILIDVNELAGCVLHRKGQVTQ